jgi:hypothetical protein
MRVRFRATLHTRISARELRPALLRFVFKKMLSKAELRPTLARMLMQNPEVVRWVKSKRLESVLPTWKAPLQEACAICFEDGNREEGVQVPSCSHRFHEACLGQWLEKSARLDCPCCRQAIKP